MIRGMLHSTAILVLLLSTKSIADQVILTNGDSLQGTKTGETESHIFWQSDTFGPLTIALDDVVSINVEAEVPATAITDLASELSYESLEGAIGLSGLLRSGNDDREEWDVSVDLSWRIKNIRHRGDIHYQTRTEKDNEPKKNYDIGYASDWFFNDDWYWSNAASFGANDNRGLDQFYSVGSLVGKQFWETDKSALSLETGLTWISETFIVTTRDQRLMRDKKDERLTWNWTTNYKKMIFENIEFFHTNQLLISVEDAHNSQFNADMGFDFPLVEDLFTKVALKWNYDNQPAEGIEKIDRSFTIGVNYNW